MIRYPKKYWTKCPSCRKRVFYYSNSNGSKVFFDQLRSRKLQRPWRKHVCPSSQYQLSLFDEVRSPKPITRIHKGCTIEYKSKDGTKNSGIVIWFNDKVVELEYFDGDDLQAIDVDRTEIVAIVTADS